MKSSAHPHLGGAYLDCNDANTFMPDVWERLIRERGLKSVIDVGMGAGWNTIWFLEHGLDAFGVEGWPEAIAKNKLPLDRIIAHDYENGPYKPRRQFDLGWSSEFVEHVQEEYVPNFLATFEACHFVCLTYATPGQTGWHHVNENSKDYWIGMMNRVGFLEDEAETARLRATDNGAAWGRKTLTFFENQRWHPGR